MSSADEHEKLTRLPRLANLDVRLVLALTFALQLYSWWRLDGYQLADSVEYIERAQGYLFGHEVLGPSSVRSFAFSALFLPFYWVTDQLGIEDSRFLVYVFRLGIAFLGLALCLSSMRLGARLGGRTAGLWTGLLVGANPIFLQYSISPVSGIAAALCVSLGLERCLTRGSFRHHAAGGLWLGVSFMMAYQTLPIAASIILCVLARDRWRHLRTSGGTLLGFSGGIAGQVLVDRFSYGEWGSSIFRYVVENAGGIVVRILGKYLKMGEEAHAVYNWIEEFHGRDQIESSTAQSSVFQSIQEPGWYLNNLPSALVWSVLIFLVIALVRSLRRPRWDTSILVCCIAFNLFLLNQKPSKSFRLWLPLFPFIFPLCAIGIEWLRGQANSNARLLRRVGTVLLLLLTPVIGIFALNQLNTRKYGIFWEATEWVNAAVESDHANRTLVALEDPPVSPEGYGAGKIRISGSYHWAMFMRESPLTFLVKLPFEIELWDNLEEKNRKRNIDKLLTLDWYIAHWPSLVNHPEWMEAVNEAFTVEAAFYEHEADPGLAALLVMKRKPPFARGDRPDLRTFLTRFDDANEGEYRDRHALQNSIDFIDPKSGQHARLLGCEFEVLPGTGLGWVSYHWSSTLPAGEDWTVVDRITTPGDENHVWQNNHKVGHGLGALAGLEAGSILRESHLMVAGQDAYATDKPFLPLGGPYLRGNLLPSEVWMKLVRYGEEREVLALLVAHDTATGEPLPTVPGRVTPRGWNASTDGLSRVGRFLIPRTRSLVSEFLTGDAH